MGGRRTFSSLLLVFEVEDATGLELGREEGEEVAGGGWEGIRVPPGLEEDVHGCLFIDFHRRGRGGGGGGGEFEGLDVLDELLGEGEDGWGRGEEGGESGFLLGFGGQAGELQGEEGEVLQLFEEEGGGHGGWVAVLGWWWCGGWGGVGGFGWIEVCT